MNIPLRLLPGPVRAPVALATALGLGVVAAGVAQGFCLALALAGVLTGVPSGGVPAHLAGWLGGFAAAVALRALLIFAAERVAETIAQRTKEHLRGRLLRHVLALGPGHAMGRPTGELQTAVVGGVEALEAYYSRYLPAVLIAGLGCTGVLAALAWMDARSALLLAAFAVAQPVVDRLWLRWRMPKSSGIFVAMGAFASALLDSLQGITTLKAFGASARWREQLAGQAARLRRESMAILHATLMRTGATALVGLGGVAAVLAFNAWRVAEGALAPAALFLTLFLAREVFRPLERLEKAFHTAWAAGSAAEPIHQLLAAEAQVREPQHPAPPPTRFGITFEQVRFRYPGREARALADFSLAVGEREFVALVGPSGAGKSTVVALLLRLFDPQAGTVRIGGVDLRALPLEGLRRLVSVVSQETVLFHGSVADNLRIARPSATLEELRAACRDAQIDGFIAALPQGYDTPVGERGAQFSGGQRQRLAIARALLKEAPILLLDEATSSVDPATDRAIQAALARLAGQRTLLVIAHRLSTVRGADRIVVIEHGRVQEAGRHAELLERGGGLYSRLLAAQAANQTATHTASEPSTETAA